MQKTTTFFMFTGNQSGKAEEAIRFYISLFKDGEIKHIHYFEAGAPGGVPGTVKHALFTLAGQDYMAMDGGPMHQFSFNPAVSVFVTCETEAEIDALYRQLSEGGATMMPLGQYGFSKKFGWIADKYGISWQLTLPS